jgi:hypothetical protein
MKLFQINADDLAQLERDLPLLAQSLMLTMNNSDRAAIRRIKAILSNVRWNYGPPTNVEIVGEDAPPTAEDL